MKRRGIGIVISMVLALSMLAGCGGSGSGGTADPVRGYGGLGRTVCAHAGRRSLAGSGPAAPGLSPGQGISNDLLLRAGDRARAAFIRRVAAPVAGFYGFVCRWWEKSIGYFFTHAL